MVFYHSLIIKTREGADGGKELSDIFGLMDARRGGGGDIFSSGTFASQLDRDTDAVRGYNAALAECKDGLTAFNTVKDNLSPVAGAYVTKGIDSGEQINIDAFRRSQGMSAVTLEADNKTIGTSISLIKEYNTALLSNEKITANAGLNQDDFAAAVQQGNAGLGKYLVGLNGAKASMGGYITSLAAAKAGEMAMQAATMALNMAISFGLSIALSAAVTAIDNWIHAMDRAVEKSSDARSNFENLSAEAENTASRIEEINNQIDDIRAKGPLSLTDSATVAELEAERKSLEAEYEIQKKLADLAGQTADFEAKNVLSKKGYTISDGVVLNDIGQPVSNTKNVNLAEYTKNQIESLKKLEDAREKLAEKQAKTDERSSEWRKNAKEIERYDELIGNKTAEISENVSTLRDNYSSLTDKTSELARGCEEVFDEMLSLTDQAGKTEQAISTMFSHKSMDGILEDLVDTAKKGDVSEYEAELEKAKSLGVDVQKTVYGNIDTNKRQILTWTDETLSEFKDALMSWNPDMTWEEISSAFKGSKSTVYGGSNGFNGLEIAFSPILQTEDGPILMTADAVHDYIYKLLDILDSSGEEWTAEDLFKLDSDFDDFMYNGHQVHGLIADIGETASTTGQAMHYVGDLGSIHGAKERGGIIHVEDQLRDEIEATDGLKEAMDAAGVSTDALISYIMNLAGTDLGDIPEQIEQIKTAFDFNSRNSRDRNRIASFMNGYSEKEIHDFYDYIKKNNLDLSQWSVEDFEYNFRVSVDGAAAAESEISELTKLYGDMAGAMKEAQDAQTAMNDLLKGSEGNQMYQDASAAFQKLQEYVDAGAFGTNSKLWDILSQYSGGELDRSKITADNYDEMVKKAKEFIELRKKWFLDEDEDGLSTGSYQKMLKDISSNKKLQENIKKLRKEGKDAQLELVGDEWKINIDSTDIDKLIEGTGLCREDIELLLEEYSNFGYSNWADQQAVQVEELDAQLKKVKEDYETFYNRPDIHLSISTDSFNTWVDSLSDSDKNIVYNLSLKTDTATWSLEKWQQEVENNRNVTPKVSADVEGTDKVEDAKDAIESIPKRTTLQVVVNVVGKSMVTSLKQAIDSLDNKTVTVTQKTRKIGDTKPRAAGTAHVFGTVGRSGSALASGNWGVSKSETALVGELGQELIVRNGRYITVGDKGAEFAKIKRGDIIFNAAQTEEIFRKGGLTGADSRGHLALASGTAYSSHSGLKNSALKKIIAKNAKKNKNKGSSTNKGNNRGNNSNNNNSKKKPKKAKDPLEDFSNWISKFFDWVEVTLDRLARKTEKFVTRAERKTTNGNYNGAADQYRFALDNMVKQLNANQKGQQKYQSVANSILNRAVKNGLISKKQANTIKTSSTAGKRIDVHEYGEKMHKVIEEYNTWMDKAFDCSKNIEDLLDQYQEYSEALYNLPFDKLDKKLDQINSVKDKLEAEYDTYTAKGSAITNYGVHASQYNEGAAIGSRVTLSSDMMSSQQNANIKKQIKQAEAERKAYEDASAFSKDLLKQANDRIDDFKDGALKGLTNAQKESIINDANSNKVINYTQKDYYDKLSNSGKAAIIAYNEAVKRYKESVNQMEIANAEYKAAVQQFATEMVDNVKTEYDSWINYADANLSKIKARISKLETTDPTNTGALTKDYKTAIEQQETLVKLREEAKEAYLQAFDANQKNMNSEDRENYRATFRELEADVYEAEAAVRDLKTELRDNVLWMPFERAHEVAKQLQSVLEGINSLIDDNMLFNSDKQLTEYGEAQLGLLARQYNEASKEVQRFQDDIDELNSLMADGYYVGNDYSDKLNELQTSMLDAASSMKGYSDSIIEAFKNITQNELDALNELIDARKEALDSKKSYYDYDKTIKSKAKDIQEITAQIAALEGVDTAAARAKRAALQADLAEKQDDLNDTVNDHLMELSQGALDDLAEALQDAFDDYWNDISLNFDEIQSLLADANALSTTSASALTKLLSYYGINDVSSQIKASASYASGTRRTPRKMVARTQENGEEIIISKDGMFAPLPAGSGVIPSYLTDRLYDMALGTIPSPLSNLPNVPIPEVKADHFGANVTQHYDNLINVEGNVDSSVITDLEAFAKQFYAGAYDYSQKKSAREMSLAGYKRRF